MIEAVLLTDGGLEKLRDELDFLKTKRRKEIILRIQEATSHGDLSENADYAHAREEQSFVEGRISELEVLIKKAQIIPKNNNHEMVSIGSTVSLRINGNEIKYTIVGTNEARPATGKISNESLVGRALLGAKKGDKIPVQAPAGKVVYEILGIE